MPFRLTSLLILITILATTTAAQFGPIGGEFRVNTHTANAQGTDGSRKAVAMNSNGDFVVVWASNNQGAAPWCVYFQMYHADGSPKSVETEVAPSGTTSKGAPGVAIDSSGNFVVVWQQPDDGQDVRALRFNSDGTPNGSVINVTSTTDGDQTSPAVAMNGTGEFVVTWQGPDGDGLGIFARLFSSSGSAITGDVAVNTTTSLNQTNASVAISPAGEFVVTWQGWDFDGLGIFARRFGSSGTALDADEFQVNQIDTDDQSSPSVGIDANGDFVIAWETRIPNATPHLDVHAMRYNADGSPKGNFFAVNTTFPNGQRFPSVAVAPNGVFVIAWQSFGQDQAGTNGVYARRYNADGTAATGEDLVNTTIANNQTAPSVAMNDDRLVAVWTSAHSTVSDVYGQLYGPPLPPTQVWVNPSWGNPPHGTEVETGLFFGVNAFSTLQDAIDAVADGGTVTLAAGTYPGVATTKSMTLDLSAGVTLLGASPVIDHSVGTLTVTGGILDQTTAFPTIRITGGTVQLDGVLVLESDAGDHYCVEISGTGALDVTTHGGNTFRIRGAGGGFVDNQGTGAVSLTGGVTFEEDATTFSTATLADNFAIEDRVEHAVDDNARGLVTWVAGSLYVTAASGSIQNAIDAATAGNTIHVQAGTYDEKLTVNKALSLQGPNLGTPGTGSRSTEAVVTATAGLPAVPIVQVTAASVVIDGLSLELNANFASSALVVTTAGAATGLVIRNNVMFAVVGTADFGIDIQNTGGNPVVARNLIEGATGDFEIALQLIGTGGTIGGSGIADGNLLEGSIWDLVTTNTGAAQTIRRNTFNRSGVVIEDPLFTVTVQENFFTPSTAALRSLLLQHVNQAPVNVLSNAFTGHSNIGVLSGASSGVTLNANSFTPLGTATNFTHILVSSSFPTTGTPPTPTTNGLVLLNNTFSNAGTASGRALDFQNHDDTATWGTITIGTAGNENVFALALSQYLRLQFENAGAFAVPTFPAGTGLTPADFDTDLFAQHNFYHDNGITNVGPLAMTPAERVTLEAKVFHKVDDSRVGLVSFGFNYLPTLTTVSNLGPTNEDTEIDIDFATLLAASNANDVDGSIEAFLIQSVSGNGTLEITPFGGSRGSVSLPQVFATGDVLHWDPNTDLNNANHGSAPIAFTVIARDDQGADSTSAVNVRVNVTPVNDAPVITGPIPATLTLDEDTTEDVSYSIADVDVNEGTGIVEFTLSATNGTLTLATTAGLTLQSGGGTGSGQKTMTYQGFLAAVNTALATVTYTPDPDYNGGDTIALVVSDLGNFGAPGAQNDNYDVVVTVNAVNDDPVLTLAPTSNTFTEGDAALALATTSSVTDIDSPDFDGGTLTVSYVSGGTADDQLIVLAGPLGVTQNAGTVEIDDGTNVFATYPELGAGSGQAGNGLLITFNAFATPALVQAVVRAVGFFNGSDDPSGATRQISFVVTDGDGGTSATEQFDLAVVPVNDPPTLSAGTLATATDEDTPIVISFADLMAATGAADVDGSVVSFNVVTVVSGVLEIDTGSGFGAVSLPQTFASGDVLRWTPAPDVNGSDIAAFTVEAVDNGTPGTATSATTALVSVNVNPVNDAPVVSGVPANLAYTENDPPTLVAPTATVTDIDSPDFDTGTFIASFVSGGTTADQLTILNSGTISTAPGAPGFIDVLDGATVFGFFAESGSGSGINGQSLQVFLNANATPARVTALLNRIEFENLSDTPTPIRTIQFTVADGDGGVDSASMTSVTITAVNDAPTLSAGTLATPTDEDTPIDISFNDLLATTNASDVDGNVVGFRVTAISSGALEIDVDTLGSFVAVSLPQTVGSADTLRWTPAADANGLALAAFSVECFDDGTPLPSQTSVGTVLVSIDVNAVNDPPTLSAGTLANPTDEDTPIDISFADLVTATNADDIDGNVVAFRVTAISSGTLEIDTGSGFAAVVLPQTFTASDVLRWTPAPDAFGSPLPAFSVEAVDDGTPGSEVSATAELVSINVNPVNDAPVISGTFTTLAYTENDPATVMASGVSVSDVDNANFDGGNLTVEFTANGASEDQLSVLTFLGISITDGGAVWNVVFSGNTIGTYPKAGAGSGVNGQTLVVSLTSFATPLATAELIAAIAYENSSDDPSTLSRTVRFTLSDGSDDSNQPSLQIDITAVNDSPTLAAGPFNMDDQLEDDTTQIGDIVDVSAWVTDPDGPDLGIAVVSADNTNGQWEYSLNGGTSWDPLTGITATNAVLIASHPDSRIRFIPNADYFGTASLVFRAWDQFTGSNGDTGVDVSVFGGATAFSATTATLTIDILPVNDAPTFDQPVNLAPLSPTPQTYNIPGWATNMSPGPANEAGQSLTFNVSIATVITGTVNFVAGPAIDEITGELTFEIDAGSDGIVTFQVTLSDDGGVLDGGVDTSAAVTLIIAIQQAVVYVDELDASLNYGDTPTTGFFFGIDAFAVVQDGLDNVADAGTVNVAAGTYASGTVSRDVNLSLAAGATIEGNGTPAIEVNSGAVSIDGGTLAQIGDAATLLVAGGDVSVDNTVIEESSTEDQVAVLVTGGTLDLNGGNTLVTQGAGSFIDNSTSGSIDALGNTWILDGTTLDLGVLADNYIIEDHVGHALDDASFGLVRWNALHVYVTQASGSIQRGIDAADSGDTVNVDVGLFTELLTIDKPLSLLGAQRGEHGDTRLPIVLANESVVEASGSAANLVSVEDDDVTIDGFVLDGGNQVARVVHAASVTGLLVTNNIVENSTLIGLAGITDVEGEVSRNVIRDTGLAGVLASSESFLDILDNRISGFTGHGIEMNTANVDRAATTTIADNVIEVAPGAVGLVLVFINLPATSPTEVNNNVIEATGAGGTGVLLRSVAGATLLTLTDNEIGANSVGAFDIGILLYNLPTATNISISGGRIENADVGIVVESAIDAFAPATGVSIVDVDSVVIDNVNKGVEVRAVEDGLTVPGHPVWLNLNGLTITAGGSAVFVESDANNVIARVDISNSTLTGAIALELVGPTSQAFVTEATLEGTTAAITMNGGILQVSASNLDSTGDGLLVTGGNVSLFQNNYVVFDGTGILVQGGTIALVFDNHFSGTGTAIDNQTLGSIDARRNWWSSTTGPTNSGNPGGVGHAVSGPVTFSPWWASGDDNDAAAGFQGGDTFNSPSGEALHAVPTLLVWTQQPPNGTAGIALTPAPEVRAQDASGNLGWNWDAANGDAFLVFAVNPTGASLTGNPVIQATNGYATFNNVAVSTGGVGFRLQVLGDHGPFSINSTISDPFNINNLIPVLTSISPQFVHEGHGPVMIQVNGSGFNSTTIVRINGVDRPTFFVSTLVLLASFTGSDTALPTVHSITVHNPAPGGGTSVDSRDFTVNQIPTGFNLSSNVIPENEPIGSLIGTFSVTDTIPVLESHTYTLAAGIGAADNASFAIVGNELRAAASYNFEVKSSYSIRVRVTDILGAWIEQVFTVNITDVNETPTAVADTYNMLEDGVLSPGAPGVLGNDTDPDSIPAFNTLQAVLDTAPNNAAAFNLNADGSFSLTPDADFNGVITFIYYATDGLLDSAPVTVTINVAPVNDAPSFSTGPLPPVGEDAGTQTLVGWASVLSFGPADESTQAVAEWIVDGITNPSLFSVLPSVALNGTLTYTAAPDANGTSDFTLRLRDNGGTANGGNDTSAPQNFTITVMAINDAPSFTVLPGNSIITVAEDSGPFSLSGWINSFSPGPANESGQSVLNYIVSGISNPGLFSGAPAVSNAGTLTFTPAANAHGSSTFLVAVQDDGGTGLGGVDTSGTQLFTIHVTPVNDAPTLATVNTLTGATEDTLFPIALTTLLAESDAADADNDPISFRIESILSGTLTMNGNPVLPGTTIFSTGQLEWTPAQDANGVLAAFSITAWDGLLSSGAPVTVSVDVAPVNDDPYVVVNNGLTLNEGGLATISQALLEVADVEQSAVDLVYELVSVPANGQLLLNGSPLGVSDTFTQDDINSGLLEYEHDGSQVIVSGSDSFTFFVIDGDGGELGTVATPLAFAITLNPVNDAPELTSVNTLTGGFEDTAFAITWSTLDAESNASDPENDPISFRVEAVSSGTLTKNGNPVIPGVTMISNGESLFWTPALDANGTLAAFTIVAFDGALDSGAAVQVSVDVAAVNDRPSISAGNVNVNEDTNPHNIMGWATMLPGGGTDEAGQTVVQYTVVNVTNASLFSTQPSVNNNGDLSFNTAPNAFGVSTIDVIVQDNGGTANGGQDTSTVQSWTITIHNVNDAPTLSFINVIFGGPEDSTINVPFGILLAASNANDIDGPNLYFRIEGVTAGSTLTLNSVAVTPGSTVFTPADLLDWTPGANLFGTLNAFTVTAFDGSLSSGTAVQVRIFVEPVNDQPSFTASNPPASLEDQGAVTVLNWATFNAGPFEGTTQTVLGYTVSGVANLSGNLAFLSGPTIDNNGNLHYTAAADTNGTAEFYAIVQDTGGTASGGVDTGVLTGPFVITVLAVNDAPSFTANNPSTILEDAGAQSISSWAAVASFGPADEGGQAVAEYIVDQISDPTLFSVQPAVDNSGTLTYTPAADAFGSSTFRVRLRDNGGTANGGVDTSAPQTFTINVTPVNDAPSFTVVTNPINVDEDAGPQTLTGWATFTAGPANESGQTVDTYIVSNISNPTLFSAAPSVSTNGTLTFTSAPDAFGTSTFDVQVRDNGGTANGGVDTSSTQTFTIVVAPINDAPTMTSVNILTGALEDTPYTITYADLQAAADEADIDSSPVNFRVEGVLAGTLTKNSIAVIPGSTTIASGESLVWTPPTNLNGVINAFTLAAWDGLLPSTPAVTVQIDVTPINDAPSFTGGGNVSVAWDQGPQSIPGWATAISAGPADEAGQTLTFNILNNTNPGLFATAPAVSPTGTLTFTPAFNVAGTATISIELQDNGGTANGGVDTSAPQNFNIVITTAGEIEVDRGGTPVASAGFDDLGVVVPAGVPINLTYTITNIGNGTLQLTNAGAPVDVAATINSQAWVTHQPATTLVTTTSTTFTVHLVPAGVGAFSIDLVIDNTDADEDPYLITIGGIAVAAPDIGVERGFNSNIVSGTHDDLGILPVGADSHFTYAIRNDGTADLNVGSVTVSNELNCTVGFPPAALVIGSGGAQNLAISVLPGVVGNFSFDLVINSNDPDESAFTIHVHGSAEAAPRPELELYGHNVIAPNGTDQVGLLSSGSPTALFYQVRNVGSAQLTVTGPVSISGQINAVAVVSVAPAATVAPGGMTVLGIEVQPLTTGPFQFNFELVTNDADESPMLVTVAGVAIATPTPDIAIDRDGTPVPHGGNDNIGSLALGGFTPFVYRIRNRGTTTLNVTRPVRVLAQANCEVVILAMPAGAVAPQDGVDFVIGVRPLAVGALVAMIRVDSDDPDTGTYLFELIGTGPQPRLQVETPEFTPQASGSLITVGGTSANAVTSVQVVIRNTGTGALTVSGVSASSETNCATQVISPISSPIAPGSAEIVTVDVTPLGGGAWDFTLTITSNDPSIANFTLNFEGSATTGGGKKKKDRCSTDESSGSWLLMMALLSGLVVATRLVRRRA